MKSYKTTLTGIVAIAAAIVNAAQLLLDNNPATNPDWTSTLAAISAGLGLMFARDNKVTSEQAGAGPSSPPPPLRGLSALLLIGFLSSALLFTGGCAALSPGADPVAVRAEQSVQMAFATFDTFEKLDHANRELFKTSLPGVHAFAEWLREPVGQPPMARGISFVESANRIRLAYKQNRTADNKASLITALAVLESAVNQTQTQLALATP